jgi:hypothetical protein
MNEHEEIAKALRCPGPLTIFFSRAVAMNFIDKSAIITGEYWLLADRTCPNLAQ